MAILNKRLLLAVAIKVIINRRHRRDFQNFRCRFWINPVFTQRNASGFFMNLIEEMRKDDREMYFR